ncbi:MAG: hypothetical protein UR99_C0051G0001 [Candidatus Moranbacteria bacterium GW2011_GWD2_36_12]|nr:MAG: hypothetical protein UR99_C0051G0001 [Candidatus Moranbacteria bacterium GW2011_GWD2_36_12]KKQ04788.1 MAG: hypothetical protein US16_C0047G0001 [Candidatus Moranbacteria bacterium GW2011_GWE2_36_40]
MQKQIIKLFFLLVTFFMLPNFVRAAITFDANGKWETTFDCDEANTDIIWSCDGLSEGGSAVSGMRPTQITIPANNVTGGGFRGARFWIGDGDDINSQPLKVDFSSHEPELWVRWYMRYPMGFQWLNNEIGYDKWLYFYANGGTPQTIINQDNGSFRIYNQAVSTIGNNWQGISSSDPAWGGVVGYPMKWTILMSGNVSDGEWHSFEVYIKMDTNSADGIGRMWVDGVLVINSFILNYSGGLNVAREGWDYFNFKSNQNWPNNGSEMPIDFDDIIVFNNTPPNLDESGNPFIGPIGYGDVVPPGAPSGLAVI